MAEGVGRESEAVASAPGVSSLTMVVGGVAVRFTGSLGKYTPTWGDEALFLGESDRPDLDLVVEETPAISLPPEAALAFDARPMWTMHAAGGQFLMSFWWGSKIARQVRFDRDGRQGVVLLPKDGTPGSLADRALRYPLVALLTGWRAVRDGGFLLHACGVAWRGMGLAFCGRSGAGKSTTSRLWAGEDRAVVLNDDRVIVRQEGEGFRLMGTPWFGESEVCANDSAPLRSLFCLRHSQENRLQPLRGARAVAELLTVGILPFYDREAVERAHDTCARLAETVPAWTYEFTPDHSAVTYLQQSLAAQGLVEG